jgi:hypothetical protein
VSHGLYGSITGTAFRKDCQEIPASQQHGFIASDSDL